MADTQLFDQCTHEYGAALERLSSAYEADPDLRRDLLQEIHVALWRSFRQYDGRCSLRTWVYRVAHNVAASYVVRAMRWNWVSLEEAAAIEVEHEGDREVAPGQLYEMIHRLRPQDRQVILLYLEGHDAESIAEVTGGSPGSVATKVCRIKELLTQCFHRKGTPHAPQRTAERLAIPARADEPSHRDAPESAGAPLPLGAPAR